MRGKDTLPRIRRTKEQIAAGLSIDDLRRKSEIIIYQPKTTKQESNTQMQTQTQVNGNGTTYLPLTTNQPTSNGTENAEKYLNTLALTVTQSVLSSVFPIIQKQNDEMIARINQVANTTKVVAAIKFNDEPIKMLKREAHPLLPRVTGMLKVGLTPLLVGPAGCGKTMLAEQCAEALGLSFSHLCFSAGASETWLFGRQTPNGFVEGEFSRVYKNGGLFLADELDAADANLLMSINTALANGHLYNPISGENIKRHENFYFIGAANTYGKGGDSTYTGRNRLDAATLDRFTVINIDYEKNIEEKLCSNPEIITALWELRAKLKERGSNEIISYRSFVKAEKLYLLGKSKEQIIHDHICASWSETLKSELGITGF